MTKILMVCLGNICRSPLAHGILESKLDPINFRIDSAGTAGYHIGNPPEVDYPGLNKIHSFLYVSVYHIEMTGGLAISPPNI